MASPSAKRARTEDRQRMLLAEAPEAIFRRKDLLFLPDAEAAAGLPSASAGSSSSSSSYSSSSSSSSSSSAPSMSQLRTLPLAPTFRPTAEEFADPCAYIASIRFDAERFGICKIVPPAGWSPPDTWPARLRDPVQYATRAQRVDRLRSGKPFPEARDYTAGEYRAMADAFKATNFPHLLHAAKGETPGGTDAAAGTASALSSIEAYRAACAAGAAAAGPQRRPAGAPSAVWSDAAEARLAQLVAAQAGQEKYDWKAIAKEVRLRTRAVRGLRRLRRRAALRASARRPAAP